MTDQVTAGAPVVYPGRVVPGVGPLHLGRSEARKGGDPAIIGMCPPAVGLELQRAARRRWWRRRLTWCPYCAALADHLRRAAREQGAV